MFALFTNKKDCCGCSACIDICPKQSIAMKPDDEGFLYPLIDESLCVECGLCKSVCPIQNELDKDRLDEPYAYALKHKLDDVRMSSSSGGAYTAISDFVITKTDSIFAIYGVEYDDDFKVRHSAAYSSIERDNFRGSKYVQSDLDGIFLQVKRDLEKGKTVLFTGTPCQTAGLYRYLEKSKIKTDNLILNDIVCHGTPSPKLWGDYVKFIEQKYKGKLCGYTFRAKEKGWRCYNVKAVFDGGKSKINTDAVKTYANLFGSNLVLRPSCYDCKFKSLYRPADITIADFWGIEKSLPEFEDTKGVSLVLINTLKGQSVFEQIKENVDYKQSNTKDCLQGNLMRATKIPVRREAFWEDYAENGFKYVANKYGGCNLKSRTKRDVINILELLGLLSLAQKLLRKC